MASHFISKYPPKRAINLDHYSLPSPREMEKYTDTKDIQKWNKKVSSELQNKQTQELDRSTVAQMAAR